MIAEKTGDARGGGVFFELGRGPPKTTLPDVLEELVGEFVNWPSHHVRDFLIQLKQYLPAENEDSRELWALVLGEAQQALLAGNAEERVLSFFHKDPEKGWIIIDKDELE